MKGGVEANKFRFYYYEVNSSHGGGVRLSTFSAAEDVSYFVDSDV